MKLAVAIVTIFALALTGTTALVAQQLTPPDKISPDVAASLAASIPGQTTTVIVKLKAHPDLKSILGNGKVARLPQVIQALQIVASVTQAAINALLRLRQAQGKVTNITPLWIMNGISVTATPDVIAELANWSEVESITPDAIAVTPAALTPAGLPEANLSAINAPSLWALGYYGQGIVVANLDSGVDVNHPDLNSHWRGGSNSWFDPYNQHPTTPTDLSGHGTWTMGVMVGGDAGGTAVGVAPWSQWIAAKIFNDSGSATATAIHQAFQWLLDPDGNPNTPDAPDVVNNSWALGGPGCNLEFQRDLQALRAAGILPVFAAGNYGPGASTSLSPANNPEAFAVGATDNAGAIYFGSSRGPSACGESQRVFPEIVAPGVDINTTELFGLYSLQTGTSLSAPHAAGAVALLLSSFPSLTVEQQQAALLDTAHDLGAAGPDNVFGYGSLDVYAAYGCIQAGGCTPPPLTLGCASGTGQAGVAYSSYLAAAGGALPYTFSIAAGALPPGLILNTATGAITGNPSASGTYAYTALASDSTAGTAQTATVSCSMLIAPPPPPPLTLACASNTGHVSVAYSSSLAASGGTAPYSFSLTAGSLPPGLTLNSTTGDITGTPTAAGTYGYTAMVTDSTSGTALTKTVSCSIAVAAAPPPPVALTCAAGTAQVSAAYSSALAATGGTSSYTYAIAAGSLPTGLTLSSATGGITGTPTAAGTYNYTGKATDSTSGTPLTATASCSIAVAAAPAASLHIGDIDRSTTKLSSGWKATVTITAHNGSHNALSGVRVSGRWSGGLSGTASCTAGTTGQCQITSSTVSDSKTSVTFTVTGASRSSYVYQSGSNHDPDGDSNGTAITIPKP